MSDPDAAKIEEPLDDWLVEEFARLEHDVRARRQAEWEARCVADGRATWTTRPGCDPFFVRSFPPPPPDWFGAALRTP